MKRQSCIILARDADPDDLARWLPRMWFSRVVYILMGTRTGLLPVRYNLDTAEVLWEDPS